ncbi:MAG: carbohydrate ABC transporter permease [Bacillota bacterium]
MRRRSITRAATTAGVHTMLLAGAFFSAMPFLWLLTTSLKPEKAVFSPPLLIPTHFEWTNYVRAMQAAPFDRFFLNSAIMTAGITVAQTLFSGLAGYALARMRFRGKHLFFIVVLAAMMIPQQVTLIPSFLVVSRLGWIDTYAALIVPRAASAFAVLLFRQFFLSIPVEIEEAARIDGAGTLTIIARVVAPLSRPVIAASAIFSFLFAWNDFLWPLVVTNSTRMQTVQVGLAMFSGRYGTFWTLLAAATVVALLPSVLAFFAGQRRFIEGIASSAVKG